ncbi:putative RNA-binding protein [Xylariales sp. AK1849]|nr:putative RNA-binding protein [Xylariales sp. AK1849]
MDDYRFRTQQSPRNEAPMNSLVSPPRNGNRMPGQPAPDPRTTLPRRFTTDSGRVPTLSTLTTQRPPEPQGYPTALEKKRLDYEKIREQRRRFEAEMEKLDLQQRQSEFEIVHMENDLGRGNGIGMTGHQSEPTTPPEYRETSSGFPTMFSRPNRYSTSSLVSPPGLFNRPGRSGSQLASPQSGILQSQSQSHFAFDDQLPSRSVPGTRRNSDEDEKEEALRQDPTSHRSTNALNRYSMPVTRRGNLYDNIDQTNAAGFLFRDDEPNMESNYTGINATGDEDFPKLIAQKGNPNRLSASSVAVDLTSLGGSDQTNGWNKMASLHRPQQSLSTLNSSQMNSAESVGSSSSEANTIGPRSGFRHSLDLKQHGLDMGFYPKENVHDTSAVIMSPPTSQAMTTPPKLQTSFSANDIPTVKNPSSVNTSNASAIATAHANAHAAQHFHNHNASIGRIPPGAVPKRHSRELSNDTHITGMPQSATFPSIGSALHANAPAFGPGIATSQASMQNTPTAPSVSSPGSSSMGAYPSYYSSGGYNPASPDGGSAYGMPLLMQSMNNMNMNGYSQQNYTGYAPMYQPAQPRDSQQRIIAQRRAQDHEAMNRFQNMPLESVQGTIFDLCKDQHGCRYLQKQLENRNPVDIQMIFAETYQHVVDLMTDPFGNYLCQKLLEYCNDEQRTKMIENAAPQMVRIALNQHGTRALQKMIEFVTLDEHVSIIVEALRYQVVDLIQDLNGNHVIQKCLNKLTPRDAQFIFDAVGMHCVDVGTHRHGCCVLQRCIDHASGDQKIWLIGQITENAPSLVQDPFGNYVVQYIIDLNEPTFTEPLVLKFQGKMGLLSRHKFSSNVIEKCLRCASEAGRDRMVNELLVPGEMERLLRDSFGNYVVQTALEHSTYQMKNQLVDAIRPVLPQIRGTPYGRRLSAKVQTFDQRSGSNSNSGQSTPADPTQGQISLRSNRGANNGATVSPMGYANGIGGTRGQPAYPSSSNLTVPPPQPPRMNQGYTYPGANGPHGSHGPNGLNVQPGHGEGQFF